MPRGCPQLVLTAGINPRFRDPVIFGRLRGGAGAGYEVGTRIGDEAGAGLGPILLRAPGNKA